MVWETTEVALGSVSGWERSARGWREVRWTQSAHLQRSRIHWPWRESESEGVSCAVNCVDAADLDIGEIGGEWQLFD